MAHHVIHFDHQCKSCNATGLYVGLAECDGSAVVCHTCRGTGEQHVTIEYDDFEGRAVRSGVTRVFQVNPGIVIGTGKDNRYSLSDFGGMSYHEWLQSKPFPKGSENRAFTCPAWWYQAADYKKKPNWDECGWGAFSACPHFKNKDKCWHRWDQEHLVQVESAC